MKLILCAVIVFCSGYIGLIIKSHYNKKLCFYTEICAFFQYLKVKSAFFKDTLSENISNFVIQNNPSNKVFFTDLDNLIKQTKLNRDSFNNIININLTDPEKQELYNMIFSLTGADIISFNNLVDGYVMQLKTKIENCQTQKKQKGDLSSKLAVCIGLLVCILIY